jgi:hypothetical protein
MRETLDGSKVVVETAGAENQRIRRLTQVCAEVFDELLERHGFARSPANSRSERDFASEVYVCGDRYIEISANTHYRDAPSHCQITLGEGSLIWPEKDWNGIALWQLACEHGIPEPALGAYPLRSVSLLRETLAAAATDLEHDAADFLAGDLAAFHRARAASARQREPYKIYEPGADGRYHASIEPESAALRERFAQER